MSEDKEKRVYRVWAKMTNECYLDVVAESAEEAYEVGRNEDGGVFLQDDDMFAGSWEVLRDPEVLEEDSSYPRLPSSLKADGGECKHHHYETKTHPELGEQPFCPNCDEFIEL